MKLELLYQTISGIDSSDGTDVRYNELSTNIRNRVIYEKIHTIFYYRTDTYRHI